MIMQEAFILLEEIIAEMNQQGNFDVASTDETDYCFWYFFNDLPGCSISISSDMLNQHVISCEVTYSFQPIMTEGYLPSCEAYEPDPALTKFLALATKLDRCLYTMRQFGSFDINQLSNTEFVRLIYTQPDSSECIILTCYSYYTDKQFDIELVD